MLRRILSSYKKSNPLPPHFLLLINKQAGRTSHDEVARVRAALKSIGMDVKVGHSGTLDPKVTGLLVIGVGRATKLLGMLLESPKVYIGELEIHKSVTEEKLRDAIDHFTGEIEQLPPQKSSVKRVHRTRSVYELELLEFSPRKAKIRCVVERGTYIRKLFHDMGEYMGVGASMGDLHRTDVAQFSDSDPRLTTSDDFLALMNEYKNARYFKRRSIARSMYQNIVPTGEMVSEGKKVHLEKGITKYLSSGADLYVPGVFAVDPGIKAGDEVAVFDGHLLVALGTAGLSSTEIRTVERGVAVSISKTLIP